MLTVIALSVGALYVVVGLGLLHALEVVVAKRRAPEQRSLGRVLVTDGGVLVTFGLIAVGAILAAVAVQVNTGEAPLFRTPAESVLAVGGAVLAAALPAVGALLIGVGRLLRIERAPAEDARLFRQLDRLTVFAWSKVVLGGLIFFGVVIGPLMIVLAPLLLAGLVLVLMRRLATQQDALLLVLSLAARHAMPLGPALEAFADGCTGRYRRRVLAVADQVEAGATLPEALGRVGRVLSPAAQLIVRTGWDSGTLPAALRDSAQARLARRVAWQSVLGKVAYLIGVLTFVQGIVGFISYFIVPKFEAIFADFGVPLPEITRSAIAATHVVAGFGVLVPLGILLELALLVLLPLSLFEVVSWRVPVLDSLFRRLHSTAILRALGLGLEGGRPVVEVLRSLARGHPRPWVRRRLSKAAWRVTDGEDWVRALRGEDLIRPADAAVLESAQRAGNLPWALREVAGAAERRFAYRVAAISEALFPLVVMALGALVFVLAVAYFSPLVTLIDSMAEASRS